MLKSRTGTDRSDHTTTWARIAVAEALFTENRVVIPFPFARSTSKYGNSRVAAGTSSTVQMTAPAGPATDNRPTRTKKSATRFMVTPFLDCRPVLIDVNRISCWPVTAGGPQVASYGKTRGSYGEMGRGASCDAIILLSSHSRRPRGQRNQPELGNRTAPDPGFLAPADAVPYSGIQNSPEDTSAAPGNQ